MQIFTTVKDLQAWVKTTQLANKTIGFVPTMGALHEGHLALVQRAKAENDVAVASIFVNPTQFNNPEDLKKYPRTLEADTALLEQVACDVIFAPTVEEMYPTQPVLKLHFGALETVMEGEHRPGHFNGVGIVVAKLFHMVQPTKAYFGLKDLQQVAVVRQLVHDLSFPLQLVPCPTLRENDGLAMSSRNRRLSADGRAVASEVYRSLQLAKEVAIGGGNATEVKAAVQAHFAAKTAFRLEYIEMVDVDTLQPIECRLAEGKTALCIAIFLEEVRLIDNIVF